MILRALIVFLGFSTAGLAASDAASLARDASTYLEQAALSLSEAESSSDRIAALTATVRAYETGLSAMREGLRQAALNEADLRRKLQGEQGELDRFLMLLTQVSRNTEQQALLHPGRAVDTIRAGTLLASFIPALKLRAGVIETELSELADLMALQESGLNTLSRAVAEVQDARSQLAAAISKREKLPASISTDDATMTALINSTETLSAFADELTSSENNQFGPETWQMPVIGKVLSRFNETDAAGIRRPGWIFATTPRALVTAPVTSSVRFSGEVPGQGLVAVLEHKPGLLVILTGFSELYAKRGQIVLQGAPIGLMGGQFVSTQEKLNETLLISGQSEAETLYIEIRQAETSRDPAEFLPRVEQ